MTEGPRNTRARSGGRGRDEVEPTPDVLEQHQRPDGSYEGGPPSRRGDEAVTPDVVEQRQRADGSPVDEDEDVPDEPLSPDMLEQRQVVEDDDWSDAPRD
jgi:hypothetical protein